MSAVEQPPTPEEDPYSSSRRSRSLSPDYERGSKRRRSSPSDDRPSGGRAPQRRRRGGGPGGYSDSRNKIPENPENLFYQVSFRHFSDYFKASNPDEANDRDALDSAYRKYKADFLRRQLTHFFNEHSQEPWFKERYDPNEEELRKELFAKGTEGKIDSFLNDLQNGNLNKLSFDQNLNESVKASNVDIEDEGLGDVDYPTAENENDNTVDDETTAAAAGTGASASATGTGDQEGQNDESSTKNPEESEKSTHESSTAATTTDKQSKEATSSTTNPNASNTTSSDEPTTIIEIQPDPHQLFIKSVSPEISRKQLEEHCAQVEGFKYLALSEPHPVKKFHRVGWVNFHEGTDMNAAIEKLSEAKIDNFVLHMIFRDKSTYHKARAAPGITNSKARLTVDLEQIRRLVSKFEDQLQDKRGTEAIEAHVESLKQQQPSSTDNNAENKNDNEQQQQEETRSTSETDLIKLTLDLYLHYLRHTFNTCYYCIFSCDFPEELSRKCAKHLRRPISSSAYGDPNDEKRKTQRGNESGWVKNLDDKISLWVDKDNIDVKAHGGENKEDALEKVCQEHIKTEEENKFRCKLCNKLFKAMNFVVKHVSSKHEEVLDKDEMNRIQFFNNFALDPAHIPLPPMAPPSDPNVASGMNMQGAMIGGPGSYNMNQAMMNFGMFGAYPNMMFNPYVMGGFPQNPMMGMNPYMNMGGMGMGSMMDAAWQNNGGMIGHGGQGSGGHGGSNYGGGGHHRGGRQSYGGPPHKRARRDYRPNVPPPEGQALDPRANRQSGRSYADLDAAPVTPKGKGDDDDLLDLY